MDWSDKKQVLDMVRQDGCALQYASDELRGDKDVVLEAVRQYGYALQFASKALRADKDVVLATVRQNGWALRYASEVLYGEVHAAGGVEAWLAANTPKVVAQEETA